MNANDVLTQWRDALHSEEVKIQHWLDLLLAADDFDCLDVALAMAAQMRLRSEALEGVLRLQEIAAVDLIRRARDLINILVQEGQRLDDEALEARVRVLAPEAKITQRGIELLGCWILEGIWGRWTLWAPPYPPTKDSWLFRECWPLYDGTHNLGALVEALYLGDVIYKQQLAETPTRP